MLVVFTVYSWTFMPVTPGSKNFINAKYAMKYSIITQSMGPHLCSAMQIAVIRFQVSKNWLKCTVFVNYCNLSTHSLYSHYLTKVPAKMMRKRRQMSIQWWQLLTRQNLLVINDSTFIDLILQLHSQLWLAWLCRKS